ncbi:hypothetical protein JG687_00009228 [Phytophthora cactorum]|uniref:Ankyrin repeat-containing domain n=1 Tax=Phytophthora cactorum TaxID=29920 RepID=A0A8T1UC91_9STRA|nr:hypothetical protein JG687_00009228 [Phytophthora cactorum]
MNVPLIGCASHRFNRAVAMELAEKAGNLDLVQSLILKLRTLNQPAKLRLRPIIRQQTRWSSTFLCSIAILSFSLFWMPRTKSLRTYRYRRRQAAAARPARRAQGRIICFQGTTGRRHQPS